MNDDAITQRSWDRVESRGGKVPLSHRVRRDSEAAPWVVEEIRKLEAEFTDTRGAMAELIEAAQGIMQQDAVQRATHNTNPFMADAADKLSSALGKVGAR